MFADRIITNRFSRVTALLLVAACGDETMPLDAVPESEVAAQAASVSAYDASALLLATDPFTIRAQLDAFRIHQLPDFMIRSNVQADFVVQRLVLPPGSVPWHTHPGPSFAIVEQGQIRTSAHTSRAGCVESPVLGPGQTFYRAGDEVHRLTVVGIENAVLYVARFNIPVGEAITIPADDPAC